VKDKLIDHFDEPKTLSNPKSFTKVCSLDCPDRIMTHFSWRDLKRLKSYIENKVEYHLVVDLVNRLMILFSAQLFSDEERKPGLSPVQHLMMVGVGLQ